MNAAGAQQSITAVILRYGSALDARDRLGVLSCFTDDVHLSFFDGAVTAHGRAEAEAFFDFSRGATLPGLDAIVNSTHVWQVGTIEVDEPTTTATATTSCVAYLLGTTDQQTVLVTRGLRYEDRLRSDASGWRITHRRHVPLWETRTPAERPDVG